MCICRKPSFVQHLITWILSALLVVTSASIGMAKSFVWARAGDALSLDPHSINEGTTHALNHHIYEPLIIRDRTGKLEAALAIAWTQTIDPRKWVFELRTGVEFHDGQPLTAEDVVFSLNRALSPTSDLRTRLSGVQSVNALAFDRVEITTRAVDPLLPIRMTDIFIMSKSWAETHKVTVPQKFSAREKTYAATNTNGTGPYKLVSRKPGKETKLARNERYWGWRDSDTANRISELSYRPIASDKDRVTALLDGSVDFVQDVPLSEIDVLRQAPDVTLKLGPENRVIFLGLSIKPTFKGKPNPLTKPELRQAISIAIDRLAIQRDIMLGQSIPTGILAPPGINGFPADLDTIPPHDLSQARKLLKSASVKDGTELTLDCPTNRYVNDETICEAIKTQLNEIGLNIKLELREKGAHFQAVRGGNSQLFLLGWGVPTFDSAYIFANLFHTRKDNIGTWNGTGFSDPTLDKQIAGLSQATEPRARARAMSHIWHSAVEAGIYIPIHVQTLMYAMRKGVDVEVDISNAPKLKHATVTPDETSESKSQ